MKPIPDILEKKKDIDHEGISNKKHTEKYLAKFLYLIENQDTRSARMCVETIEMIRDQIDDGQKKPRIPQVIPQLKFRVRCITFGMEQTTELCVFIARKYPDLLANLLRGVQIENKDDMKLRLTQEKYHSTQELKDNEKNQKQKDRAKKKYHDRVILNKRKLQEVEFKQRKKPKIEKEKKPCGLTKEQWSALVPVLFPRLFSIPHRLKKVHDVNVVTTDGVSASWHVHTRTKCMLHVRELHVGYKPIGDQGLRVLVANDIGPGYYGRVGEDCCFVPGPVTCVIGIDPGHANIIVAAKRSVNNPMRSKFNLKNTTWRHMNGIHQYLQRVTSQGERHGVPIAASHLARCSSRSLSLYGVHITGRLVTAPVFTNIMRYTKCTSCEEQSTMEV